MSCSSTLLACSNSASRLWASRCVFDFLRGLRRALYACQRHGYGFVAFFFVCSSSLLVPEGELRLRRVLFGFVRVLCLCRRLSYGVVSFFFELFEFLARAREARAAARRVVFGVVRALCSCRTATASSRSFCIRRGLGRRLVLF